MEHTYTRLARRRVAEINEENFSSEFAHDLGEHTEELEELLKEFDRPFSEGLTRLLKRAAYEGDPDNLGEKRKFILAKIKAMGVSVDDALRKTISNWLGISGIPQVNDTTRDRIYLLCFALSLSADDVDWFFNHVFFQRSFNCHRLEGAVYYYCFLNHYPYCHAQQLIMEIQAFLEMEAPVSENVLYTREIQQQLEQYATDEEVKGYFRRNAWAFRGDHNNQRAKENICRLLGEIRGKKADKEIAVRLKEVYKREEGNCEDEEKGRKKGKKGKVPKYVDAAEIESCGLVVQEILCLHKPGELLDFLTEDNDITSIPVMLKCIYGRIGSEDPINISDIRLPSKGRRHFPYTELLDMLIKGIDASKNYDAIRKLLILLKFYQFWCIHDKLHPFRLPADSEIRYETYLYETNNLLMECGYNSLFEGNCYDALFMLCSGSAAPLETLRNFLASE